MIAILYERYGEPDVLELREIEKPVPGAGEILVRVQAVSINSFDYDLLRGQGMPVRFSGFLRKNYRAGRGLIFHPAQRKLAREPGIRSSDS